MQTVMLEKKNDDGSWPYRNTVPCGLSNPGNTSFMNSVLQVNAKNCDVQLTQKCAILHLEYCHILLSHNVVSLSCPSCSA